MNKITCNVCGTSYPENASQCPICGFAHTPDSTQNGDASTYTYVKGGRFSKSNVRKRNQASQKYMAEIESDVIVVPAEKKKSNVGAAIVIIVLILAISAVVGYIAMRFFLPNSSLFEGLENFTLPTWSQNEDTPADEDPEDSEVYEEELDSEEYDSNEEILECESIALNATNITLSAEGETFELFVGLEPVDTTDIISYESSDQSVATVDEYGVITAVGEGNAVITVTCGSAVAECTVECVIAEEIPTTTPLVLNRKEITFEEEGDSWILYDGTVDTSEILWSSDNNEVATIENGKVVAVGVGDTTIYATYNGSTASCLIHCVFDEQDNGSNSGVGEADGDAKRTYKLYNPYGRADDVTIKVGSEFPLTLVDEDKNEVKDATWKVEKSKICSYNKGKVKGLAAGTTKVTASYDGKTYTCIVRVK